MSDYPDAPQDAAPIRILVADDHPVVRDGLVVMLNTQPDFQVIGECSTGREVLQQVAALKPDVILLDLEMPEMDGLEALRQLRQDQPEARVLVFTAFDTDERILGAVKAGAKGYLLKGAPREDIFRAIRIVSQGGSLLEPVVASKLMSHLSTSTRQNTDTTPAAPLTGREMEVLGLLAEGLTNKEIADRLVVTERTVKFHVSAILRKLDAANRTEAVRAAVNAGLVDL